MEMKFTLREGYDKIGGTVGYGSGKVINIREALGTGSENGNCIYTDDPHLQQVLSEYRGSKGYVFDVATVVAGEETPVTRKDPTPAKAFRTPAEGAADVMESHADHSQQTGYWLLPMEELQQIAMVRGLKSEADMTKGDIIDIIEKHDAAEAAGTGA